MSDRPIYVDEKKKAWVRHYEATDVSPEHYQAYRAKHPFRDVIWQSNNTRIADKHGFKTLQDAIASIEIGARHDLQTSPSSLVPSPSDVHAALHALVRTTP